MSSLRKGCHMTRVRLRQAAGRRQAGNWEMLSSMLAAHQRGLRVEDTMLASFRFSCPCMGL